MLKDNKQTTQYTNQQTALSQIREKRVEDATRNDEVNIGWIYIYPKVSERSINIWNIGWVPAPGSTRKEVAYEARRHCVR